MNARSLKFQLIVWYAVLLIGGFALVGAVTYLALQGWLLGALKDNQMRRARQIAQLARQELERRDEGRIGAEIEARYAPGLNDRFVRISRRDGVVTYLSQQPGNQSFDPSTIAPTGWPDAAELARQERLPGGRKLLLTSHRLEMPGAGFLIETGAPMDEVQADLRKWVVFLGIMLGAVGALALGGGYVLVKRALSPVDRIASSAERISSSNLSERLPIAPSGDEIERLSVALNHMIARLEAAFQHSRRFMADASHELRTPLTVLKGELESFVQEPRLTPEWRDRMGSALEEVDRLITIVEGLFAISRLDAGEAAAECVPFDLAQMATSTADQMSLLADDKQIQITCAAEPGVWVEGDRARMKQVVVNLLDNAIKYTPDGGAVALAVRAKDSKAVLEVADTGIGIPAPALPRVFERFFRVDKARSRDQGGAGLGLSIVQSICAAHQGRVEARSTPGQGSRFRVELPLVTPPGNHVQQHKNS